MEALRHNREEDTPPPSVRLRRSARSAELAESRQCDPVRLPKLLQHELDWFVMRALEKDRSRRYQTVNGLARDLERYLSGEPVEAASHSKRYRLSNFVRKHRTGLVATFTILLLGGDLRVRSSRRLVDVIGAACHRVRELYTLR